jgi:hypothetical protein
MLRARLASLAGISFAAATVAILVPTEASAATTTANPRFIAAGQHTTLTIRCLGAPGSATLTGTEVGLPSNIAMDKRATGKFSVTTYIPRNTMPGAYEITMQCSNGDSGSVSIHVSPRGGPDTGDGAASGVDMTTAVVGGGAVALAAVGGAIMLGRRQNLDSDD